MNIYENALLFKGKWRTYQQRILDHTAQYLQDGRCHIVAAPGSGKTTLGIELIRRQGAPCLILSPSITIRQQWISRIKDGFLKEGEVPENWLSNNIRIPAKITSITYQALHSSLIHFTGILPEAGEEASADEEIPVDTEIKIDLENSQEIETVDFSTFDLFETLRQNGITTLCLDEAHHLRSEWWKALEKLTAEIPGLTIISLTATPPYDSSPAEWKRYMDLCGPIDEEIFAPELVKEGSLCPHQDYVYFNWPTKEEKAAIDDFEKKAHECFTTLCEDQILLQAISSHPGLKNPEAFSEKFLDKPSFLYSLLIYLQENKIPFSSYFTALLDVKKHRLPALASQYLEPLLQNFLYDDPETYQVDPKYRDDVISFMKSKGCIQKKKVSLVTTPAIEKLFVTSKGKLKSIIEITRSEVESTGSALRLLILCDFIKKETISRVGSSPEGIQEIGAVPIFENLRLENIPGVLLGVLSGGVVIIPESAVTIAVEMFSQINSSCQCRRLLNTSYVELTSSANNGQVVKIITEIFHQGAINVLIGTKSLLGEGWDSPCINSLIMASFVGSFMLSNQMRGRAIRTVPNQPDKASNIWHLVCVNPKQKKQDASAFPSEDKDVSGDFRTLRRRFETFLGIAYEQPVIESGLQRIGLEKPTFTRSMVEKTNRQMLDRAQNRAKLRQKWKKALENVQDQAFLVQDVAEVSKDSAPLGFLFINNLFFFLFSLFTTIYGTTLMSIGKHSIFLYIFLTLTTPFCFYRAAKFFLWLTPEARLLRTAEILLSVLQSQEYIKTQNIRVRKHADSINGFTAIYLQGGETREKTLFAASIAEFYRSIENQRYILKNQRKLAGINQYFAVPEVLSRKKEDAEALAAALKKMKVKYIAVYTRSPQGRKILLDARIHSFAYLNEKIVDRKKKVPGKFA